jgi:hypothetical protein
MLTAMRRIPRLIISFGLAARVMSDAGIHSGGRGADHALLHRVNKRGRPASDDLFTV